MIDTLVIDIDGTLIGSDEKIQPKTKKALIKLQEEGVKVILASGRPLNAMLGLVEELELTKHHGIVICYNGAMAYDAQNKEVIFNSAIDKKYLDEIIDFNLENDIAIMIQEDEYMLVHDAYKGVVKNAKTGKDFNVMEWEARNGDFLIKEIRDMKDYIDFPVNKILTIVEPERLKKEHDNIIEKFKDKVHAVQSAPHFMEYLALGVNKASAIEKLKLNPETLMTFGDGNNDKEMVELAKYGVCMGNGSEKVKEVSSYITDTNDNEGIYKALVHFELVKE